MLDKILITGASGQLGQELTNLLPNAVLTDMKNLDITDAVNVLNFVKENGIGTIINCAAYTEVDKAEDDIDLAQKVNVLGPENLAKTGCKIVHISTDYVFDGKNHRPYTTEDVPHPLSMYGQTKRDGELAVLNYAKEAIIIRTAWLYSSYGNNFVKTIRNLALKKQEINVVNDQIGTPTYAYDLAEVIVKILPQISKTTKGIYHFTNEGVCSWYDFAMEIIEMSGLKRQVNPIPSSEYPTRAVRPLYAVMDKEKIKKTFNLNIQHWKKGLEKCLKQF